MQRLYIITQKEDMMHLQKYKYKTEISNISNKTEDDVEL